MAEEEVGEEGEERGGGEGKEWGGAPVGRGARGCLPIKLRLKKDGGKNQTRAKLFPRLR